MSDEAADRKLSRALGGCSEKANRLTESHRTETVPSSLPDPTEHSVVRLVQIMVPVGAKDAVVETLTKSGIDHAVTDETSSREFDIVITFPLPTNAVESVLSDLRDAGIDEDTYTVIVDAETVISRRFDELADEYKERERSDEQIAREELQSKAESLVSGRTTYMVMTVLSSVIATAGLLLDSAATVVGSMVIAPLIGPALAASVGTVVDDHAMFTRGIKLQVSGVLLAIASAALFASFLRFGNLVPPGLDPLTLDEVSERLAPNVLVLAIAIGSGIAGILSLMTGVSVALVGVMIAVALIPPAATTGIGIAYGIPTLAIGSGVFVMVNVLSINFAALIVLWYAGYRPEAWFRTPDVRSAVVKRIAVLAVCLVILSAFLAGITFDSYTESTDEQRVEMAVDGVLADPVYREAEQTELTVHRTDDIVFSEIDAVVVTVAVPTDHTMPSAATPIQQAVANELGYEVSVELRFVQIETAD